jgi:ATP-binding cassette, subfamily B, bacterial MsbA
MVELYRNLRPYLTTQWSGILTAAGAAVVLSATSVANIVVLQHFLDNLAKGGNLQQLLQAFFVFMISIVVNGIGTYVFRVTTASVYLRLTSDVRRDFFRKVQTLSLDYFLATRTGEVLNRMLSETDSLKEALNVLFVALRTYLTALVMFIAALNLSVKHTLIATVVIPVTAILVNLIAREVTRISHRIQADRSFLAQVVLDSIERVRLIRIFQREDDEQRKFTAAQEQVFGSSLSQTRIQARVALLSDLMKIGGTGIVFVSYGRDVLAGTLSAGSFVAFVLAIKSLQHLVTEGVWYYTKALELVGTTGGLFRTLQMNPSVPDEGRGEVPASIAQISFKDVTFRYPSQSSAALSCVNLTVRQGEVIAVLGGNGSGKSTLVNLLPRFFDPSSGAVLIDGVDIRQYTMKSLRACVGMVTQHPGLYDDTIYSNIAVGKEGATEEEVRAAAIASRADEFISRLPLGYQTRVGEKGSLLSEGQKQRIAIARAFLKNAPILILDEPTSALDASSRDAVALALESLMLNRVVFVVTHDLSILPPTARMLRLEHGHITGLGPLPSDEQGATTSRAGGLS